MGLKGGLADLTKQDVREELILFSLWCRYRHLLFAKVVMDWKGISLEYRSGELQLSTGYPTA